MSITSLDSVTEKGIPNSLEAVANDLLWEVRVHHDTGQLTGWSGIVTDSLITEGQGEGWTDRVDQQSD